MKNKLQPTRITFSRNFQCKKASRWLSQFFHFGTENGEEQLKKHPVCFGISEFCGLTKLSDIESKLYHHRRGWSFRRNVAAWSPFNNRAGTRNVEEPTWTEVGEILSLVFSFVISNVAIRKRRRGGNSEYSNSKDLEMSKSRLSFSFFSNFLSLYFLGGEIFPRRINAVKHHHNNNSGMVAGLGGGGGQFMLICRAISNILTSVIFNIPDISYILCII